MQGTAHPRNVSFNHWFINMHGPLQGFNLDWVSIYSQNYERWVPWKNLKNQECNYRNQKQRNDKTKYLANIISHEKALLPGSTVNPPDSAWKNQAEPLGDILFYYSSKYNVLRSMNPTG
jgi:hypothetical protein